MTLDELLQWHALKTGTEICWTLKGESTRRKGTIIVDGYWQRGGTSEPLDEGLANVVEANGFRYTRKPGSNAGRFIAIAGQGEFGTSTPVPIFISKTQVACLWSQELERREAEKVRIAKIEEMNKRKREDYKNALSIVTALFNPNFVAKAATGYHVVAPGLTCDTYSHMMRFEGEQVGKLAMLLSTADVAAVQSMEALVASIKKENALLKERAERAEEQLNAIRFMLNSK